MEKLEIEYPSFASMILDQILRCIDEEDGKNLRETMATVGGQKKRKSFEEIWRKVRQKDNDYDNDYDKDVLFFSSTSCSSDSSTDGVSSSTETGNNNRTGSKEDPVRTSVTSLPLSRQKTLRALLQEARCDFGMVDDYQCDPGQNAPELDETITESKPTTMKMCNNFKKLRSFIKPLLAARRSSSSTLTSECAFTSTCSSASLYPRSCLRKNSSSGRQESSNGSKKTVRFSSDNALNVGKKRRSMAWRIGKSSLRKGGDKLKHQEMEKSKSSSEKVSRMLLKDYVLNQENDDLAMAEVCIDLHLLNGKEDDGAASYSSSDLFEINLRDKNGPEA